MHLVQNTLRDGDEFNWILTHKDTEDIKESWFQPGDMDAVRKIVSDCDPRIAAAVMKTKECLDWKICYRDPIPSCKCWTFHNLPFGMSQIGVMSCPLRRIPWMR